MHAEQVFSVCVCKKIALKLALLACNDKVIGVKFSEVKVDVVCVGMCKHTHTHTC